MPEETTRTETDFEVYCMYCNRALTEDDDIHFTCGPYGFDFDVVCGTCMDRAKQLQAGAITGDGLGNGLGAGLGVGAGIGMGLGTGDIFDGLMSGELDETPEL